MAYNKKQTSTLTKVVLIFLAVAFVLSFAPGLFISNSPTSTSSTANGALDQISQQYSPQVNFNNQALASDPTSYTVLLSQAYAYHDWANDVAQSTSGASGADIPLWVAATAFYERALEETEGDPGVRTDLAIAYYYGGQTANAITNVERVMTQSPDFGPAFFNAGVFYRDVGRKADALRVLLRSIEIDPAASTVDTANQWIGELQAEGIVPSAQGASSILDAPSTEETSAP